MLNETDLIEDCANCADLCCVAFEFDAEQGFSLEKPVNTPCEKLCQTGGCSVHATRSEIGMSPCLGYSCQGAGQYVTQTLFAGAHWRRDPKILAKMTDAMRELAVIREQLVLLFSAQKLALPDYKQEELAEIQAMLDPAEGWTLEALNLGPSETLKAYTHAFLRTLTSYTR